MPGDDAADADTETTRIGYDPVAGGVSGWGLRQATTTSTDPTPGRHGDGDVGDTVTSTAVYDVYGNVTQQIQPGSSGSDAGTTVTQYYGPGGSGLCSGHPEWAGLACTSSSAAAPAGGSGFNVMTLARYGTFLQPTMSGDMLPGGRTRGTTATYDDAGRVTSTAVVGGVSGDEPVPATTYSYDPNTGIPTAVTAGVDRRFG